MTENVLTEHAFIVCSVLLFPRGTLFVLRNAKGNLFFLPIWLKGTGRRATHGTSGVHENSTTRRGETAAKKPGGRSQRPCRRPRPANAFSLFDRRARTPGRGNLAARHWSAHPPLVPAVQLVHVLAQQRRSGHRPALTASITRQTASMELPAHS